jgi:mRNA interferase RelE/StbE
MYELELSRKAAKFYQKADAATARRLNVAFDRLAKEPLHHHSIKSLAGELQGSLRMRIGDIRIVYSIDETTKTVFVEVIGFRGDVYK